jgi:hypothetical protein
MPSSVAWRVDVVDADAGATDHLEPFPRSSRSA